MRHTSGDGCRGESGANSHRDIKCAGEIGAGQDDEELLAALSSGDVSDAELVVESASEFA